MGIKNKFFLQPERTCIIPLLGMLIKNFNHKYKRNLIAVKRAFKKF